MTPPRIHDLAPLHLDRPIVFLDTETTGSDPNIDRVVQIALIRLHPDGTTEEFESLVNPGMPIPLEAQVVHGITDAMVEFAPSFKHLAPALLDRLKDADLSGYNIIRFDVPLLRAEFERCGCPWNVDGVRIVDSQVIFHKMEPRDLSAAMRFFCGCELEGAHGALADTRASLLVLLGQLRKYQDLPAEVSALDRMFHQIDRRFVDSTRRFIWRNGEAVINFGKRRGQPLREAARTSPDYLHWILNGDFSSEVKAVVQNALKGIFPTPPEAPAGVAAGTSPSPETTPIPAGAETEAAPEIPADPGTPTSPERQTRAAPETAAPATRPDRVRRDPSPETQPRLPF